MKKRKEEKLRDKEQSTVQPTVQSTVQSTKQPSVKSNNGAYIYGVVAFLAIGACIFCLQQEIFSGCKQKASQRRGTRTTTKTT